MSRPDIITGDITTTDRGGLRKVTLSDEDYHLLEEIGVVTETLHSYK